MFGIIIIVVIKWFVVVSWWKVDLQVITEAQSNRVPLSVSSLTWQPPLHTGKSLVGPERWDIWPSVEWHRSNMCSMTDKSCQPSKVAHQSPDYVWVNNGWHVLDSHFHFRKQTQEAGSKSRCSSFASWFMSLILKNAKPARESWPLMQEAAGVIHHSAGVHPACTKYTYIKLALKQSLYWWIYWSTDHRCYYGAMFYHTSAASFHSNRMLILLLRATCTGHHSFIHLWRSSLAHLYSEYYLLLAHLAYPSKAMVVPPCICSYDTFFSSAISEMCHS